MTTVVDTTSPETPAGDLGGPRGAATRRSSTVGDLMSEHVVTATAETTLRRAANLMRGRSLGCLVVVKGRGKLAGILTVSDLLEQIGRGAIRPTSESIRWTLRGRGQRRPRPVPANLAGRAAGRARTA